jgi:DNA polymerase V
MLENNKKTKRIFALVDCNNFFASCERLFRPELNDKPVVVLSNNDGCVIARSNEAKALGIPMGAPAFKFKDIFEKYDIQLFSTNFTLYGDISNRVMSMLASLAPQLEIYSVDEAFMIFDDAQFDIEEYCRMVSAKVFKEIGMPISIGIGKTKTLAKLANKVAKDDPEKYKSVFSFEAVEDEDEIMKKTLVEKIWGVGRKNKVKLNELGIYSVLDFKNSDRAVIKRSLTVAGERTQLELNGISCIEMEEAEFKNTILTSRTFAKSTSNYKVLEEALSSFASRASEKLRKDKCACMYVTVFITTNRHRKDESQYSSYWTETSEMPLNYTSDIIKLGLAGLKKIYKEGYVYKRLGVVLSGIVPNNGEVLGLFEKDEESKKKNDKLGKLLDQINRTQGRDFIRIASGGRGDAWKMGQHMISKRYTTDWRELLEVS